MGILDAPGILASDPALRLQKRHDLAPVSVPNERVMTSPPTVTVTGTYTTPVGNSSIASGVRSAWNVLAGAAATGSWNLYGGVASSSDTNASNHAQAGTVAYAWTAGFWFDGDVLDIWVNNTATGCALRILVNDEYVSRTPVFPVGVVNSGAYQRITVNFGSADVRKITLEMDRLPINSVHIGPGYTMWPTATEQDIVAVVGDSYTAATNCTATVKAWHNTLGRIMRWKIHALGEGGTGYLNPGTGSFNTFINRIGDIPTTARVLCIWGGINDLPSNNAAYTAAALQQAVTDYLTAVVAARPNIRRIYVGGCQQPLGTGIPAAQTAANAAISAAVTASAAAGIPAVFIDPTGWITGSGLTPIATPVMTQTPVVAASGGTFAAGTYYAKVTALNSRGETVGSNEMSATVALNGTITWSWNTVFGATSYRLYRGTAAGAESAYQTIASGSTVSLTDTGAAGTAGTPPGSDTTGNITNNGNAQRYTTGDGVHYTDDGGIYLGTRWARAIAATLAA